MDHEAVIREVNELIEVCAELQEQFKEAASYTSNHSNREFFHRVGMQYEHFYHQLKRELSPRDVALLGLRSGKGRFHRTWDNMIGGLIGNYEESNLEGLIRDTESSAAAFRAALSIGLPEDFRSLISGQLEIISQIETILRQISSGSRWTTYPDPDDAIGRWGLIKGTVREDVGRAIDDREMESEGWASRGGPYGPGEDPDKR